MTINHFLSQKFTSNAYAKPIRGKIKIKTEHSVRQNLHIKSEKYADQNRTQTRNSKKDDVSESFVQEKNRLLDTLTNLKSENQRLTFDLKKKSNECTTLKRKNENLAQKTATMMTKINGLNSDLSQAKSDLVQKNAEHKHHITNLAHQKQLLSAQLEQLKTSIGPNNHHENINNDSNHSNQNSIDNDEYEVEQLLDDKMKRNVRYYLVHWKGYSSEHDTWERVTNLNCPEILEQYEATKHGKFAVKN